MDDGFRRSQFLERLPFVFTYTISPGVFEFGLSFREHTSELLKDFKSI